MSPETATILGGVIGGVVAGVLTIAGALLAVRNGVRDLEKVEIRKDRVECIVKLYGLRQIFASAAHADPPRSEDVAALSFEVNRLALLFADSQPAINALRNYRGALRANVDPMPLLVELIRNMCVHVSLNIEKLSDDDLLTVINYRLPPSKSSAQSAG